MTVGIALLIAGAIGLPHLLRLDDAPPIAAATIWLSAVGLRALAAIFAVVFLVFYLPGTELFALVTRWCWHAVLPLFATHLGFSGHQLGDAATIAPAFLLAVSLLSVVWALWRAARAMTRLLQRAALGGGPDGSVIIGGPDVFVAAAGIARPKVVVSAGALATLDDEELAAGLAHERGHIARRHSHLLVIAEICRGLARFLPGTRAAAAAVAFHLERDADRYALEQCHDPLALASAICKAAGARTLGPALQALGGGSGLATRVSLLTAGDPAGGAVRRRGHQALAVVLAAMTLVLAAALPATAIAGAEQLASSTTTRQCPG